MLQVIINDFFTFNKTIYIESASESCHVSWINVEFIAFAIEIKQKLRKYL